MKQDKIHGYDYFTDEQTGKTMAVQRSTGECTETITVTAPIGSRFYTPEQIDSYKEKLERERERKLRTKRFGEKTPPFTFVSTSETFEGIKPADLARLIYLSTFMRINDGLLQSSERRVIHKAELSEILRISQSGVDRFLKQVIPKYLVIETNGTIRLNQKVFVRGKLGKLIDFYIKIFAKGMSELYTSVPKSKHKYLGYVFAMLQFVNTEHNVLCYNPDERNIENIEPMTMREFCEEIGYDYNHVDRLHDVFKNLKFDVGDGQRELFCSVIKNTYIDKEFIVINPRVFYSGSNPTAVAEFGLFF